MPAASQLASQGGSQSTRLPVRQLAIVEQKWGAHEGKGDARERDRSRRARGTHYLWHGCGVVDLVPEGADSVHCQTHSLQVHNFMLFHGLLF